LFGIAIFFCAVFYTAFVLDPEEVADDLKSRGGAIAGVAPGAGTADHVDDVLSHHELRRLYLALVCLVPEILIVRAGVPFFSAVRRF
jgi:preprotein translocase subunit SecY